MNTLVEKITRLYQDEQSAGRKAYRFGDIPCSYAAITPEWLTAILCKDHPGAEVVGFSLDRDRPSDGLSNSRRIFIRYNTAGSQVSLPASIFCKACHDLGTRLMFGVTNCGQIEVDFFNKMRDSLDIEAPRACYARNDPESMNSIVVMEDMPEAQFFQVDTEINRERASQMLALLAKLHGTFYDPARMTALGASFINFADYWMKIEMMDIQGRSDRGFRAAERVIPTRLFAQSGRIWDATKASVERHREVPLTCLHGDCHLKNWYLSGDGHIGLNDWQCLCTGHWSRDVAYALTTCLSVENRRLWERDLLAEYIELLHAAGGPKVTFAPAWKDYRCQILPALAFWTFTLGPPPGQTAVHSNTTMLEFVRRMAHAIDDLDSLNAFA